MVDIVPGQGRVKKILKVIVVGEPATGKTSLIRQYVRGFFSEFYKMTIGVDFANKEFEWDDATTVSLQLWDIAGQERHGNMARVYFQEAVGALVVFDVTRLSTFDSVVDWKKCIDSGLFTATGDPIPCVLLGNKIDLCQNSKRSKSDEEMDAYIRENGFIQFFVTSAREGLNIDEAAKALVKHILDHKIEAWGGNDDEGVALEGHQPPESARERVDADRVADGMEYKATVSHRSLLGKGREMRLSGAKRDQPTHSPRTFLARVPSMAA
jgi:small GTP-binding protein